MRTTIDTAGRLVVPKPLREQLGFAAGIELEVRAVDGHLEVAIPSRVSVEEGPHGVRFVAEADERLGDAERDDFLQTMAGAGVFGGASYDGLVALEAKSHGRTLLTLDERAQSIYRRLGAEFTVITA